MTEQLGLDRPVLVQYAAWLKNALAGDLGALDPQPRAGAGAHRRSACRRRCSSPLAATLVGLLLGVPVAIVSALRPGSWLDRLLSGWSALALGVPTFWLGILLILLFAVELRWLPSASGYVPFWESRSQVLRNTLLPALHARRLRLRHLRALPARLAHRASCAPTTCARPARRACASATIVGRHVLRNALLPFVTIVGLMMANFIGGTVVTEAVFTYPGLGRLLIQAISTRDYPLIQGCILVILVIYMRINLAGRRALRLYRPAHRLRLKGRGDRRRCPRAPSALFDLTGQVALVTGASRGLGWAMARALAAAGARVVLNGRDPATLEPRRRRAARRAASSPRSPPSTSPTGQPWRRPSRPRRAARPSRHPPQQRRDRPCASRSSSRREADWQGVIDADLTAGWRLARDAARVMIPAGYGRMIVDLLDQRHASRGRRSRPTSRRRAGSTASCGRSRSSSRRTASP